MLHLEERKAVIHHFSAASLFHSLYDFKPKHLGLFMVLLWHRFDPDICARDNATARQNLFGPNDEACDLKGVRLGERAHLLRVGADPGTHREPDANLLCNYRNVGRERERDGMMRLIRRTTLKTEIWFEETNIKIL